VRCSPPLARPWKYFTGDFIWKGAFLPFSSNNCKIQQCLMVFCFSKFQKNGRICGFHWTFRSKECFSFRRGGFAPDPRYRLALRALAMSPLCQILNRPTPLGVGVLKISLDLSGCREWIRCRCWNRRAKFCSENTEPCLSSLLQRQTIIHDKIHTSKYVSQNRPTCITVFFYLNFKVT